MSACLTSQKSDKEIAELRRMLDIQKKKSAAEMRKYKGQALDANKEVERLRKRCVCVSVGFE